MMRVSTTSQIGGALGDGGGGDGGGDGGGAGGGLGGKGGDGGAGGGGVHRAESPANSRFFPVHDGFDEPTVNSASA